MSTSLASRSDSPPQSSALAFLAPQQVSCAFAHALSAGDLDVAASLFATDACFVTPDATAIHGIEGIRAVLTQLTASRAQLEVMPYGMHKARGLALCNERWTLTYDRTAATPLARTSDATVLLRRRSTAWELLTVAPWGLADGRIGTPSSRPPWRRSGPVAPRLRIVGPDGWR